MQFILVNEREKKQDVISTPFTLKQWLSFHFCAWRFYKVIKDSPKKYSVYNTIENTLDYTIITGGKKNEK